MDSVIKSLLGFLFSRASSSYLLPIYFQASNLGINLSVLPTVVPKASQPRIVCDFKEGTAGLSPGSLIKLLRGAGSHGCPHVTDGCRSSPFVAAPLYFQTASAWSHGANGSRHFPGHLEERFTFPPHLFPPAPVLTRPLITHLHLPRRISALLPSVSG